MLKLYGFAISNYYSKVKFSLLEKGVPFEEVMTMPSQSEEFLKESPMGKVPFLRCDEGILTESQVITEYIEDIHPEPPLFPREPFARARCRELIDHIELNVELPARRLAPEVFFGKKISDETRTEVEILLRRGLHSLKHLARFAPFIAGDAFTHADCCAFVHLPVVAQATKKVYGRDLVAELLPEAPVWLERIGQRPHAQKVSADRTAALAAFAAKAKK